MERTKIQEKQSEQIEQTVVIHDGTLRHGFAQIPNVVLRDTRLSGNDRIIYCLLLSYAWQAQSCFPGQLRLIKDTGFDIKTIGKNLQSLQKLKLIKIERRGQGKVNIYHIRRLSEAYPSCHDGVRV